MKTPEGEEIAAEISTFMDPLILGRFFDTVGRRQMIAGTYITSGALLILTGYLFTQGFLSAYSQTALWTVIFFFASVAASSAYLTVSEIFPPETRAMAISFFYALGTGAGGIGAPWLFGTLIGTGSRMEVYYGYLAGAFLMLAAAVVEMIWGVKAERASLEKVAAPLSVVNKKELGG
jgi:MFS family permease